MPLPFASYLALIMFHSLSAVDFVSHFVERTNTMIRKLNKQLEPYSLLSFLLPGTGLPFQLEFIVKFLRLSDWRRRAFAKFVLENRNRREDRGEDGRGWEPGHQSLEGMTI